MMQNNVILRRGTPKSPKFHLMSRWWNLVSLLRFLKTLRDKGLISASEVEGHHKEMSQDVGVGHGWWGLELGR